LRRRIAATYSPVPDHPKLPPIAIRAVVVMLAVFGLVAIYSNVQRFRRDKIETVIVTPIATPVPSASPTPGQ